MTSHDLKALDSAPRAALSVSWNADSVGSADESTGSVEFRQHLTAARSRTGVPRSPDDDGESGSVSVTPAGHPAGPPHKAAVRPGYGSSAKPLVRPVRKTAQSAQNFGMAKLREPSRSDMPSVGVQPASEHGERGGLFVIPSRAYRDTSDRPEPRTGDTDRLRGPEMETANRLGHTPDHRPIESSTGDGDSDHLITDLVHATTERKESRPSPVDSIAASEPELLGTERGGMPPDLGVLEIPSNGHGSVGPTAGDLEHEPLRSTVTPYGREPSRRSAPATPQSLGAEGRSTGSATGTLSALSQSASSQSQTAWTATWEGMPSDLREVVVRSVQASVTTAPASAPIPTLRSASNADALRSMILKSGVDTPSSWLSSGAADASKPLPPHTEQVGWPNAGATGAGSPTTGAGPAEDSALRTNPIREAQSEGGSAEKPHRLRDAALPAVPMEQALPETARISSATTPSKSHDPDAATNREPSESDRLATVERFDGGMTRTSATEEVSPKSVRTAGPGLLVKPDGLAQRGAFDSTAGRDHRRDGDPDSATRPSEQAVPFDGHGRVERGGSERFVSEETLPDRSLSETTAATTTTTTERWIASGPIPSEPRTSDRLLVEEPILRHSHGAEAPKSGAIRHIHLDTAEAQGVELQLQTVGEQLVIRTQDLLGSLEGESARWKDLQQRLEASGIVLLPIEPRIAAIDSSSNTQTPSNPERHTGCYDGSMDTSGREHSGSRSTTAPQPSRRHEATSTEAGVTAGESVRRNPTSESRGWWA